MNQLIIKYFKNIFLYLILYIINDNLNRGIYLCFLFALTCELSYAKNVCIFRISMISKIVSNCVLSSL